MYNIFGCSLELFIQFLQKQTVNTDLVFNNIQRDIPSIYQQIFFVGKIKKKNLQFLIRALINSMIQGYKVVTWA